MDAGRIRVSDSPKEIKRAFSGEIVELIARPQREARNIVAGLGYVCDYEIYGERLQLTVEDAADAVVKLERDLAGRLEVVSMQEKAPTMESAFIAMIKAGPERQTGGGVIHEDD